MWSLAANVQVLQRTLPRPVSLDYAPEPRSSSDAGSLSQKDAAEALLFSEMRALLQHDAGKYPMRESKKDKKVKLHCHCLFSSFFPTLCKWGFKRLVLQVLKQDSHLSKMPDIGHVSVIQNAHASQPQTGVTDSALLSGPEARAAAAGAICSAGRLARGGHGNRPAASAAGDGSCAARHGP